MSESDFSSENNQSQSLGHVLQKARQDKKWSVGDVASHLRLRESVIQSLESGEYPEESLAYVKGYIRAYGKLVEIDQEWLNETVIQLDVEQPQVVSPVQVTSRPHWLQQLPLNTKMVVLLFSMILLCLMAARIFQSPIDEQAEIRDLVTFNQTSEDSQHETAEIASQDELSTEVVEQALTDEPMISE